MAHIWSEPDEPGWWDPPLSEEEKAGLSQIGESLGVNMKALEQMLDEVLKEKS